MLTVPDTFAPSVSQGEMPMTPATGPWVSPMRNSAPTLLAQTGQTLQQAGEAETRLGNTIGDSIQNTMDESMAKSAVTQFLKSSQDILYNPQSGYLNTRGMDAQTQWTAAAQGISKARTAQRDSLTNPIQQRMFDEATNGHVLTLARVMGDHQHEQVTQYSIQSTEDLVDSLNLEAKAAYLRGDMGAFQRIEGQAADQVMHVAALNGADPGSPIAQAMLRAKRTELVQGITLALRDDHKIDQMKQFFDDQSGNIDMRAAETLGSLVKAEYDRNLTETKGDGFLAAAQNAQVSHSDQYMAVPSPKGLVERGNLPIWNRPIVQNADGSVSSEYSTSFQDDQGHEVLVPTVVNGKFLTPDGKKPAEGSAAEKTMFQAAWQHYLDTGENLGKFDNADDADAYAEQLHNRDRTATTTGTVPYTYGPLATGSTINPMRIADVPGSPRPDGRVHDGYDIAMPSGTAVTAPLDGKVVKVWNDTQFGGGLSMRVQLADGNTLGIAHLSRVNLNEGDAVNKGQVLALSGKTGNATGNVLHVALQNPDGQYVDYFGASQAQPDRAGIADPDVLDRAIAAAKSDPDLDPEQQRQVIRYMKSEHTNERIIQEQQYQESKQQAVDWMAQNNNNYSAMPAALKLPLRPSDAQGFQDMQDEDKLAQSDLDAYTRYYSLPPEQRTPAWVKANYQNLKPETYRSLLEKSANLQQSADNLAEANVQDTMFRNALRENNFTNLLDPKSDPDKQQLLQLRANVDDLATSMQAALGRKLRPDEWQNVLDSQLKQQVFVEKGRWLPGVTVDAVPGAMGVPTLIPRLYGRHYGEAAPLATVPQAQLGQTYVMSGGRKVYSADVPAALRMQYELNRFKNGLPITEQGIADDWVHFGMPSK